jgi:phasin family protein
MNAKESMTMINEMSTKGFDRLNTLGEINLRAWEKLTARQMDAVNAMVEQGIRQMKLATEAKGYNEFMKGQVELAKELSGRMMEETKANMQMAGEVRDQYRTWVEQGVSELTSEMRKNTHSA